MAAADKLSADLAAIEYLVLVKGASFKVRKYCAEPDYSAEIADVFSRFRQGVVNDHRVELRTSLDANSVEAKVLEFLALLHPEVFSSLEKFSARKADFADPTLMNFDREVQFFVAYLEHIGTLKRAGLAFCYPEVSDADREVHDRDGFDLALAAKLTGIGAEVVRNSFQLRGSERIFVVSGPNQGGKTTFARAFGQMQHLASIGCAVPGTSARLFLFDALFTHFEREESTENPQGMLQQDLIRMHAVLETRNATEHRHPQRDFQFHNTERCGVPGPEDHGEDHPSRSALRVRDLSGRADFLERDDREHGQHCGPGRSSFTHLSGRAAACGRTLLCDLYCGEVSSDLREPEGADAREPRRSSNN